MQNSQTERANFITSNYLMLRLLTNMSNVMSWKQTWGGGGGGVPVNTNPDSTVGMQSQAKAVVRRAGVLSALIP